MRLAASIAEDLASDMDVARLMRNRSLPSKQTTCDFCQSSSIGGGASVLESSCRVALHHISRHWSGDDRARRRHRQRDMECEP
jgi:hypothetical protein